MFIGFYNKVVHHKSLKVKDTRKKVIFTEVLDHT